MKIFFRVHFLSYEYQHLQMFKNDKNQPAGVSTKIEVASRFEKSNQLYQKEAFTSLFLERSGGVHPLKISKFQFPKMRFPAFWALNWVQKIMCSAFQPENSAWGPKWPLQPIFGGQIFQARANIFLMCKRKETVGKLNKLKWQFI